MSNEIIFNEVILKLAEKLSIPFYLEGSFIIGALLSSVGILFSLLAFVEAKKARKAAIEAGKTVKIQTITIELTEISHKLDKLDFELKFTEARDLLNEISRKIMRLIAPFQSTDEFSDACINLKVALEAARMALEEVKPIDNQLDSLPPNTVYFATQGHFFTINILVAEILGLFEKRNIEGSNNGK